MKGKMISNYHLKTALYSHSLELICMRKYACIFFLFQITLGLFIAKIKYKI